jgi:hypothetical protein
MSQSQPSWPEIDPALYSKNIAHIIKRLTKMLKKPGVVFRVTVGHQDEDGVSYAQFVSLWDAQDMAAVQCILWKHEVDTYVQYHYDDHLVGRFFLDGRKPEFFMERADPVLCFKHASGLSLIFYEHQVMESRHIYQIPKWTDVIERRTFTCGDRITYDLIKKADGPSVEQACKKEPKYYIQMLLNRKCYSSTPRFARGICTKSVDLLGLGPRPKLVRYSFKRDIKHELLASGSKKRKTEDG